MVTSASFLSNAGPLGSVTGLIVGTLLMLIIARNYGYMMACVPEAGGSYAFVRSAFGYNRGFLTAWFLTLTYFAMLWANATALPLFARYFLGDVFRFGRLYTLFGYDVYFGEAVLSIFAVALAALLCYHSHRTAARLMLILVILLSVCITVCFVAALALHRPSFSWEPLFLPESGVARQVFSVVLMSPWAFIGFESISHGAEEFAFRRSLSKYVLFAAVVVAAILYIFVTLLSVTAYPPEYGSWLAYIRDLGNVGGVNGLPPFYAAQHYLGGFGLVALMLALLALVVTSLIGNIMALGRLFYALSCDKLIPPRFSELNKCGAPGNAILFVAFLSVFTTFLGRTAISWIVDVNTLCATLVYGFVSAATFKTARFRNDRRETATGLVGLALMIALGAYTLLPALFTTSILEVESYFLFVVWSVLGIIYFRVLLRGDAEDRFGNAIVIWIVFVSMILFVSMVWMSQSNMQAEADCMARIQSFYETTGTPVDGTAFLQEQLEQMRRSDDISLAVVIVLFGVSLGMLVSGYNTMQHRARASETELGAVRKRINTDPLTGVKSKHAFAEAEERINLHIGMGDVRPFSVVVCDVNGLKHVNDTLGHKAGDQYIVSACRLICGFFKHSPVYRIGGDEFLVIIDGGDFDSRGDILVALDRTVEDNIAAGRVVVSAGLADYADGDSSFHAVFERADKRMYERKMALKSMGAKTRD